jgi:hypothetical protein
MSLITLALVLAFAALYLSRSLEKKPEALVRVVDKINPHIDIIALWGAAYGAVCFFLSLLMHLSAVDMLVRLAANGLVVLMALPFIFEKLAGKYADKVNPAIMDEARNFVSWIVRNEKAFGYAGTAAGVLLFVVLFR